MCERKLHYCSFVCCITFLPSTPPSCSQYKQYNTVYWRCVFTDRGVTCCLRDRGRRSLKQKTLHYLLMRYETEIYDFFYIITCLKIYYLHINNKTRSQSNRTSNSPKYLQVVVLSYVQNQAYFDRHTDSTENSIIVANKGKFLTVFN
jgi:hypothetical protein